MTEIKPERKNEKIYFGETVEESFWLETPPSSSPLPARNNMEALKSLLDDRVKDGLVCVFSEELSSKPLCELLAKARDNGNRVYILTNDFNDEMKNLDGCLIRYGGSRRIGSFLLINPKSANPQGCLFTGRFSDGSLPLTENILFPLDAEQAGDLFRCFCWRFWKYAEKERIGNDEHTVDSAPVDIYPPVDNGCDFRYLQSLWGKETEGAPVTTSRLKEDSFLKFSGFSKSNIVCLFSSVDDNLVRSLKQKNNAIIAIDNPCLVNSVKTGDGIWLVPKIDITTESEVYALPLNSEQSKILDSHIINLSNSKTKYQYIGNESRKNLAGKAIIKLGETVDQKHKINAESKIKLEHSQASELLPKEQFDTSKPDFTDDGTSVSIIFEWTNTPFSLPNGSGEHPLYSNWDAAKKNITSYIEHILNTIEESEKKEKTISNRIAHFFLGKQQKFKEYRADLEGLKYVPYSHLEKNDLLKKVARINEIRTEVSKDSGEIAEADRKARIEERINAKQDEKTKLSKMSNDVNAINESIKKIDNEIKTLQGQLKSPDAKPEEKEKKNSSVLSVIHGGEKNKNNATDSVKELLVPQLEKLPAAGELYQHNGRDYLDISYWEEYDEGKKEASRLGAKLCAKGGK